MRAWERERETHRCRMWGMISSESRFLELKSHASLQHTSSILSLLSSKPDKANEQSKTQKVSQERYKQQKRSRNGLKKANWKLLPCGRFSMVDWSETLLAAKEVLIWLCKQWENEAFRKQEEATEEEILMASRRTTWRLLLHSAFYTSVE